MSTPLSELFPHIPVSDLARLHIYKSGRLDERWGVGLRPALLVVDMTRAFVEDSSSTAFVPDAVNCVRPIADLLEYARTHGLPVFFSKGMLFDSEVEAGGLLRGRGMAVLETVNRSQDHEIVSGLAPRLGEVVVCKPKPSAFFGTQLSSMLNLLSVDTLIVTGVTTSGCVRATVNDAFSLNFRVIIPVEGVGDRAALSHEVELFDMAVKYADVMPYKELIGLMESAVS